MEVGVLFVLFDTFFFDILSNKEILFLITHSLGHEIIISQAELIRNKEGASGHETF